MCFKLHLTIKSGKNKKKEEVVKERMMVVYKFSIFFYKFSRYYIKCVARAWLESNFYLFLFSNSLLLFSDKNN